MRDDGNEEENRNVISRRHMLFLRYCMCNASQWNRKHYAATLERNGSNGLTN